MSKAIINIKKYGLSVNTFYGGEKEGKCVQFTTYSEGFAQMKYKNAIRFLKEALNKLENGI